MKLALGCDHRGVKAIRELSERLEGMGHEIVLLMPEEEGPCDYPDSAWRVCRAVNGGEAELGILICGTGIGVSIAANKIPGIRAAVAHDELTATMSRTHNNANVLCLSGDLLGQRLIEKMVDDFLKAEFEGGRHARRVAKIEAIERGEDPTAMKVERPNHAGASSSC